ncbi:CIRBP [Branchiostoma lanceolatum]|uniref:CIRBP protein n=1 Tax=Branchiostoma lanceolatum TaxID=7740 RepID=A0A8J9YZD7_BRALA|nr:CIRBP [Branchiostoma lanceolatum]
MSGEREQGKLFVGGLSWNTTSETLESQFSEFGEIIDCKVITDRESGRSRGFGFVTFSNDSDASEAKKSMNNTDLDGRQIRVDYASKKSEISLFDDRVAAAAVATGVAAAAVEGIAAVAADTAAVVATEAVAAGAEAEDTVATVTEAVMAVADTVAAVAAVVATTMILQDTTPASNGTSHTEELPNTFPSRRRGRKVSW